MKYTTTFIYTFGCYYSNWYRKYLYAKNFKSDQLEFINNFHKELFKFVYLFIKTSNWNCIFQSINYKMRFSSFFAKRSVSLALSALSKLYVTKTVGEILFDGYDEPILKSLSYLPLVSVMDRFGLFYGVSTNTNFTMYLNM